MTREQIIVKAQKALINRFENGEEFDVSKIYDGYLDFANRPSGKDFTAYSVNHWADKLIYRDEAINGGKRPGAGAKKRTPPDAKRHNITVTDDEFIKVVELIKNLRGMK